MLTVEADLRILRAIMSGRKKAKPRAKTTKKPSKKPLRKISRKPEPKISSIQQQGGHQKVAVVLVLIGLTLGSIGFFGLASLSLLRGQSDATTSTNQTVTGSSAQTASVILETKTGFPAALDGYPASTGAAFDIDGDGSLEIVQGTSTGCVYVFSADGTQYGSSPAAAAPVLNGGQEHCQKASPSDPWPVQLAGNDTVVGSQPKPAQLDDDPELEFVIGTWRTNSASPTDAKLFALDNNGTLLWQTPISCGEYCTSPTVADINADGKDELFFSTENSDSTSVRLMGISADSTPLNGWPKTITGQYAVVSVDDMTGSGTFNVFATTGSQIFGFSTAGKALNGWPQDGGAMTLGDVQGDSEKEIITIVRGDAVEDGSRFAYMLRVYDMHGNLLSSPKWNHDTLLGPADVHYLPLLANLDSVGPYEIILADSKANLIYAFHSDGSLLYGWPEQVLTSPWPTIGDINGDGRIEVVTSASAGNVTRYTAFTRDGELVPGFPFETQSFTFQPLNADIDNDGIIEMIFPKLLQQTADTYASTLTAVQIPLKNTKLVDAGEVSGWRMWGRDTSNSFRYSE